MKIKIVSSNVIMPPIQSRRFKKEYKNKQWSVKDFQTNSLVYKGSFEDVTIACYNLNKKHYL